MAITEQTLETGHEERPVSIEVWDLYVRLFHWSLAAMFATAWYSGGIWDAPHLAAGYCVLALIVARTVWGFVGSRFALFSEFIRGPQVTAAYISKMLRMRSPRYVGHNPAGASMVIALLIVLLVLCVSGVLMTTDAFWGVEWVDILHATASTTAIFLIVFHIGGVIFASIEHRENLVMSMVTGLKRAP